MDGTAYIALGSNLGVRRTNLANALAALAAEGIRVASVSPVYESAPMYIVEQPAFMNAAACVTGAPEPMELLELLLRIETRLGRIRAERFGPREIDLDILLYGDRGDVILESPRLTLPHPRILERAFVLLPMADIAGHIVHPLCGRTFFDLANEADHSSLTAIGALEWGERP